MIDRDTVLPRGVVRTTSGRLLFGGLVRTDKMGAVLEGGA